MNMTSKKLDNNCLVFFFTSTYIYMMSRVEINNEISAVFIFLNTAEKFLNTAGECHI